MHLDSVSFIAVAPTQGEFDCTVLRKNFDKKCSVLRAARAPILGVWTERASMFSALVADLRPALSAVIIRPICSSTNTIFYTLAKRNSFSSSLQLLIKYMPQCVRVNNIYMYIYIYIYIYIYDAPRCPHRIRRVPPHRQC
jgi:hypothetical protein